MAFDERNQLLVHAEEDESLIKRTSKREQYWSLAKALCGVFCCPPIPSRIVAKLAFVPPDPPGYCFDGEPPNMSMFCAHPQTGHVSEKFSPSDCNLNLLYLDVGKDKIACTYLRRKSARFTLLISHGNAEDLGYMTEYMRQLSQRLNCSVFSYDYPGYGVSTGSPTEQKLYRSIEAAWNSLRLQFGIPARQIVLYGVSIGTAPSIYLCATLAKRATSNQDNVLPAGLILHSPLSSGLRVFRPDNRMTWCCDPFQNISMISKVVTPTLIIHGTEDEIVPVSHGYALHAKCDAAVPPLFIESGGHNDLDSFPIFYTRVREFLGDLEVQRRKDAIEQLQRTTASRT
eukprot:m.51598 g.51598  ORF g.51598 m.51598 type:complete len:343 (-) comp21471_c1_seq2:51-1079(-)